MSQETSNRPAWQVDDELVEQALPPITRLQLIKYAGASGDFNPIHTIDAAAEEAGLPGIIAHGMLTLATMGLLFSPYLEDGYVKELKARFSGMVFLGDEMSIGGRVLDVVDRDEGNLYTFEVSARRGEDVVASGTVGFVMFVR